MMFLLLATIVVAAGMFFFSLSLTNDVRSTQGASSSSSSPVSEFWKKKKAKTNGPTNQPVVIYKTNQFHWSQVESSDYRKYIANLRAVGCPESTIRDIIITDIMRLYAVRRGQFYHNGREFKFWETEEKRKLKAKQLEEREKQLATIDKEIPIILRELLGINYEREMNKYFVDTDDDNRKLSFLSQEKRSSVLALRDEIEGMREKVTDNAPGGKLSAEDIAKLKKIEEYRLSKLGQLLTGPEFDQLELSTSDTAERLRKELVGFNPTEDEFRELYRLQREHDQKYAFVDSTNDEALREKEEDAQKVEEEILARLDANRAQDYARTKNPEYRNLAMFTEVYDLPSSTTQSLFEIEQAVKAEKQALLTAANLSEETRTEGLRAIQAETEKTVRRLLGDQLYGKFTQSAGDWIPKVSTN